MGWCQRSHAPKLTYFHSGLRMIQNMLMPATAKAATQSSVPNVGLNAKPTPRAKVERSPAPPGTAGREHLYRLFCGRHSYLASSPMSHFGKCFETRTMSAINHTLDAKWSDAPRARGKRRYSVVASSECQEDPGATSPNPPVMRRHWAGCVSAQSHLEFRRLVTPAQPGVQGPSE